MRKHKLVELRKIIEDRIGSLTEEVEIATNVKLNPLYIADRKDEIEFFNDRCVAGSLTMTSVKIFDNL